MSDLHSSTLKRFIERLFIAIVFFVVLGPFFWCVLLSFQGMREVNSAYVLLIPTQLHLENYRAVITNARWLAGFGHSLCISLASTALNLLLSAPMGFALARVKFPFKNFISHLLLMFIFMPTSLLAVPIRQMFESLGLLNTIWSTALPMSILVFSTLMFWRFYKQFPHEIDDCATLLGMGPLRSFTKIYLPVSNKVIMYTAMIQFLGTWNSAFIPMFMYDGADGLITVQESLLQFAMNPNRIYLAMVAVILTCLPCWILFISQFRIKKELRVNIIDPFHAP